MIPEEEESVAQYGPADTALPRFYQPQPRGLELRIGDKLAELRAQNEQARRSSTAS